MWINFLCLCGMFVGFCSPHETNGIYLLNKPHGEIQVMSTSSLHTGFAGAVFSCLCCLLGFFGILSYLIRSIIYLFEDLYLVFLYTLKLKNSPFQSIMFDGRLPKSNFFMATKTKNPSFPRFHGKHHFTILHHSRFFSQLHPRAPGFRKKGTAQWTPARDLAAGGRGGVLQMGVPQEALGG